MGENMQKALQVIHLCSQEGQPYGSARVCCNMCGLLLQGKNLDWVETEKEFNDLVAPFRRCNDKSPEVTSPSETKPARRPRGNFGLCGGRYWVSYGPKAPLPDNSYGFELLIRSEPLQGWVFKDSSAESEHHPDVAPVTVEEYREIVSALCALLVEHGVTTSEVK